MEALYDQTGAVYAWLHENGRIYGLGGDNLAFVDGNSVFDWGGAHVGWWQDGHIRDSFGAVALFTAEAQSLGVLRPMREMRPLRPLRALSPMKPMKSMKPARPMKQSVWSGRLGHLVGS
jgi:hypothetical protein